MATEPTAEHPVFDIHCSGGQVEVTRTPGGWEINYRVDGHYFVQDWMKHKVDAVRVGKGVAKRRNAKLLVEA